MPIFASKVKVKYVQNLSIWVVKPQATLFMPSAKHGQGSMAPAASLSSALSHF